MKTRKGLNHVNNSRKPKWERMGMQSSEVGSRGGQVGLVRKLANSACFQILRNLQVHRTECCLWLHIQTDIYTVKMIILPFCCIKTGFSLHLFLWISRLVDNQILKIHIYTIILGFAHCTYFFSTLNMLFSTFSSHCSTALLTRIFLYFQK